MKWTVENYKELFEKYYKMKLNDPHMGSKPTFLFDDEGEFNNNNWCGLDYVRHYCEAVYDGCIKDIRVHVQNDGDDWIAVIILGYHIYTLHWYKSRGATEAIYLGRHKIDIEEYVELMNELNIEFPEHF